MNERRIELEGEIERMKQRLSYNIKRYRKLSRVSQQALADCLNVQLEDLLKE